MASFDSVSFSAAVTSGTTITWNHTLGGGGHLTLIIPVMWLTVTGITIVSVSYGAQSASRIPSSLATDGGAGFVELWGLQGPVGNQTITVTMSNTILEAMGGAVVAQNAAGFNTPGINSGVGTANSVVCNSALNEFVVAALTDSLANATDTITTTSGTERWNQVIGSDKAAGSTTPGAGPTVTSTWTSSNAGDSWCASAVSIQNFVSIPGQMGKTIYILP